MAAKSLSISPISIDVHLRAPRRDSFCWLRENSYSNSMKMKMHDKAQIDFAFLHLEIMPTFQFCIGQRRKQDLRYDLSLISFFFWEVSLLRRFKFFVAMIQEIPGFEVEHLSAIQDQYSHGL
ncbi:PREDICTED: uncharacterized protein LOC104827485 [Tarenaya hassleriana]|uniref:uncharacterized protein LOC104827485 n=1 Tax=Tarenaya hassleriana TaxID=28532 RepID=UPI00053C0C8A|nr:PREDICTED: uncharacterized protein LOC104827485 [Tarenaya hassleriana]